MSAFSTAIRAGLCFALGFGTVIWVTTRPLAALVGPEAELVDRVNQLRVEHKLKPLKGSVPLALVAKAHAEDMAQRHFVSHTNLNGESPLDRVKRAGIAEFRLLAENIASSSAAGDRQEVVIREWMNSRDHRENLLNPAFNTTGVAVVRTSDGRTLYVQLFLTR